MTAVQLLSLLSLSDSTSPLSASPEDVTPVGLLSLDAGGGGDGRPSAADLFAVADEADPWPAPRAASLEPCHSSSDEEDEDEDETEAGDDSTPAHISMEVDTSDPWVDAAAAAAAAADSPQVAMDTNLWEAAPAAPTPAPAATPATPAAAQWTAFDSAAGDVTTAQQSTGEAAIDADR